MPINPQFYPNLSREERAHLRGRYLREQKGLCYFCKSSLFEPPPASVRKIKVASRKAFAKFPVHLHHDHRSGFTLGAVHAHCNAVLWQYHGE